MVKCQCSSYWNHRNYILQFCVPVVILLFFTHESESLKKHLTFIKSPFFPHHVIVKPGIGLIGVPLLLKDPLYHLGQFGSFKAGLALGSAGGAIGGTVTGKVLGKLHGHHHKVIKKVPVPFPLPLPFPIPIKIPLPRIQINKEITQEEPVRYVTKTKYIEPEPEPEPEPRPRKRKKKKSHSSHSSSEETEKVITINLGK